MRPRNSAISRRPVPGISPRAVIILTAENGGPGTPGGSSSLSGRESMKMDEAQRIVDIANKARVAGRVDRVETHRKTDFSKNKKTFELKWGKTQRITVISKSIDSNFLNYLNDVANKYAKEKSWLYVITPKFSTKEFFEKYSNLTFYNFKKAFYFRTFLKIIFKKKKMDFILCDNKFFLNILKRTKVFHNAKSGMIGDTL